MKGLFEILVNGKLKIYHDYRDIPEEFDNVIKFLPEIPPPPHSQDQHEDMEKWNARLTELIRREKM
jgi:hypothetical protein